eukprot:142055-Amphidinium_carterae.1
MLWSSKRLLKVKILVFRAAVINMLTGAAETQVYKKGDIDVFESFIAKHGRVLLMGEASGRVLQEDGATEYKAWSNNVVRERLWLVASNADKLQLELGVPTDYANPFLRQFWDDLHAWADHDGDFGTDLIIRGWGATASL